MTHTLFLLQIFVKIDKFPLEALFKPEENDFIFVLYPITLFDLKQAETQANISFSFLYALLIH